MAVVETDVNHNPNLFQCVTFTFLSAQLTVFVSSPETINITNLSLEGLSNR